MSYELKDNTKLKKIIANSLTNSRFSFTDVNVWMVAEDILLAMQENAVHVLSEVQFKPFPVQTKADEFIEFSKRTEAKISGVIDNKEIHVNSDIPVYVTDHPNWEQHRRHITDELWFRFAEILAKTLNPEETDDSR